MQVRLCLERLVGGGVFLLDRTRVWGQDEERLDFAINEVDILKRVAQVPGACRKLPGLAVCQGSGAGREFIVQYFSHKASFVDGKLSVSSSESRKDWKGASCLRGSPLPRKWADWRRGAPWQSSVECR